MENQNTQERTAPIQYVRGSRAFRQFKNPPQPHMCIQDSIRDTSEKLYINVLGWQKIANPKQYSDPIPLYGGMQVRIFIVINLLIIVAKYVSTPLVNKSLNILKTLCSNEK